MRGDAQSYFDTCKKKSKKKKATFSGYLERREVKKYQGSGGINMRFRELFTGHACV